MAAAPTTKLQVNFKLADGTLINVYADSEADLNEQLTAIGNQAETILAVGNSFGSATPVALVQQKLGGSVVSAPAQAAPALGENQCQHGNLVWREGQGPKGPWKGWFCPAPKGTPGQCAPKFVRG